MHYELKLEVSIPIDIEKLLESRGSREVAKGVAVAARAEVVENRVSISIIPVEDSNTTVFPVPEAELE